MEEQNDNEKQHLCLNCRKKLELGTDVVTVEQGVIGPRGVVPLGGIEFFCGDPCVAEYYDDRQLETQPRRVP